MEDRVLLTISLIIFGLWLRVDGPHIWIDIKYGIRNLIRRRWKR